MRKELDEALVRDFPLLFKDRNGNIMETPMAFGFEVGDGWEPLIRRGAEKLEKLIKESGDPTSCASQVKEKYGTLRFYMRSETDEMSVICSEMENESETTCEKCGAPGKLRGKGWYFTACDEHSDGK